ncbi:ATP-grasp fold amidoligase family protein [Klebsiella pneumoniae]
MKKIKYHLKYIEYLFRSFRTIFTDDVSFHAKKLNQIGFRNPDLINPLTLNEKICHRLIFERNSFHTMLADKVLVREYVKKKSKLVNLIPLVNIYKRVEDIDFEKLPSRFVLKCNHDSGSAVICTDRANLQRDSIINNLKLSLKKNMYYTTREWQYKNISPFIICEEYLDIFANKNRNVTPEMLRIHCFNGSPCFVEADFTDENGCEFINVYDTEWNLQPFQMEYPNTQTSVIKPEAFHKCIISAQELSKDIDYCRVDLMIKGKDIYFSEITLSPKRGKLIITPSIWDAKLGSMWNMSMS